MFILNTLDFKRMNATQDKQQILKLAENLDNDLERKDIKRLIPYFSEDCEIEIFGLTLKGHTDLNKWQWFEDENEN